LQFDTQIFISKTNSDSLVNNQSEGLKRIIYCYCRWKVSSGRT